MPEHKLLRGEGSGRWLPLARSKVRSLHTRARGGSLTQHLRVDGGMVDIRLKVQGEERYIKITRKPCPPFLSGLCDLQLRPLGDGVFTPIYQVPDPDDAEQTIDVFRRFFPSPATPDEDRDWRDEPNLALDEEAAKQMIKLKASQFSSEMRKVVQVLQGMGVFIPYSPLFAKTHGVFRASNGQRWIIEVSNGGVAAWPMSVCNSPIFNAAGEVVLDYTPIATPRPQDIAAAKLTGSFIELIGPAGIQEFYNKSPFFTHCGWAFNADGHRPANVCFTNIDGYLRSSLYRIEISEVEDRPVAATLIEVSSGWMLGPLTGHMKYPNARYSGLASFTLAYRSFDQHCEAPVYCYYDGDDLEVAVYHYSPNTSGASSSNNTADEICVDYTNGGLYEQIDRTLTAAPGFAVGGNAPPTLQHTNGVLQRILRQPASFLGAAAAQILGGVASWRRAYVSIRTASFNLTETLNLRTVLIVPLLDREAMYYALEARHTTLDHSIQSSVGYCSDTAGRQAEITSNCSVVNDTEERITLQAEASAGSSEPDCPNNPSSGMSCFGPGSPCNTSASHTLYDGADAGTEIVLRTPTGGVCAGVPAPLAGVSSRACFDVQGGTSTNYTFTYIASGGVRRTLGEPVSPDDLFGVIGLGESQVMISLRDAFRSDRYFASPDVALTDGYLLGALNEYPATEVGAVFSFIGVP